MTADDLDVYAFEGQYYQDLNHNLSNFITRDYYPILLKLSQEKEQIAPSRKLSIERCLPTPFEQYLLLLIRFENEPRAIFGTMSLIFHLPLPILTWIIIPCSAYTA